MTYKTQNISEGVDWKQDGKSLGHIGKSPWAKMFCQCRALFAPFWRRNFGDRSSHIQEIVWLNADKNADKWIFQNLGNPQTLGIAGGQRWN